MNNIEKAKELINLYTDREFGYDADFSDLHNIGLAYTTLTDKEIQIQISVDIIEMKLKTWIGDIDCEKYKPKKVIDIKMDDLEYLDFDDLIYGWQTYIEDNMDDYV